MRAFPTAFRLLAIGGGLYVVWLGAKTLLAARRDAPRAQSAKPAARAGAAFRDGFAVQFANPKIVLFFAAVLPPFLDSARPIGPQLAAFAVATIAMDGAAMSAYGVAGSALSRRVELPAFRRAFHVGVGALLLGVAAMILFRK